MSKVEWDKKTGGVILKRHVTKQTLGVCLYRVSELMRTL